MPGENKSMSLEQAFKLIEGFATVNLLNQLKPVVGRGDARYLQLVAEKSQQGQVIRFPAELEQYLRDYAPESGVDFTQVGNPIELWPLERMSWHLPGYNFNPVENQPIDDWDENWFLIADEGADPIMVDLSEQGHLSPVYRAMHGAGCWEFEPIADSIGQFLLCAAAMHHALDEMDIEEPVQDDDLGFNLCEDAAKWLFPFIRRHATEYQDEWLSVFDNA